jgi:hypothetical protein
MMAMVSSWSAHEPAKCPSVGVECVGGGFVCRCLRCPSETVMSEPVVGTGV